MKEEIIRLRLEGKTYSQISKILDCAKSTVAYHCGEGQKQKSNDRIKSRRKTIKGNIERRITGFVRRCARDFKNSAKHGEKKVTTHQFKTLDILDKIGKNPVCYITGEKIDLLDYGSYHLDHMIPIAKGGENSLDNLNIATRNANFAKSDMLLDEFIELCEKVLKYNKPEIFK
jgi:5-methylcytosine-specific restriction endonuclease McrA